MFIGIILTLFLFHNVNPTSSALPDANETKDHRFLIDAVIRQLFELLKDTIKNGSDKNGVPVLDPYTFDSALIQFNRGPISGTMKVTNGIITGVGDQQLRSFTFTKTDISVELELYFPLISILAEYYEMEGKILEFMPLHGKGILSMEMRSTAVKGKIFFKQSEDGKSILIKNFDGMRFEIENIKSDTEFDGNIDKIVNSMIEDLLARYLSKFSKYICEMYSGSVIQSLNVVLNKLENWYIIATIL